LFIFKKSKIVLDCFTSNKNVLEFTPIDKAIKFYPEWLKNTPKFLDKTFYPASTIKNCTGIIDYYKQGFMIPLWTDLSINVQNRSYQWQFADYKSEAKEHNSAQWDTYVSAQNYGHLKLISPFKIISKNDIDFHFTKPFWNFEPKSSYYIPSGNVNYKYNHSTEINMFIDLTENKVINIDLGTPLAHIIPLTDKEVILKHHLISDEEYKNLPVIHTFVNSYSKYKKLVQNKESKCPFGFK